MLKKECVRRLSVAVLLLALLFFLFVACGSVWPSATGKSVRASGNLTVDFSNASDGYMMVKSRASNKKLKLRISLNDTTLTYDLNGKGEYEVFPLQLGTGRYTVTLYRNVKGNQYSQDGQTSFRAEQIKDMAPYLCPSQYVNYSQDSPLVSKAQELCEGLTKPQDKFDAIAKYVKKNFVYDYIGAISTKTGQLPKVDKCFADGKGICQDLAGMMAAMLRSQDVPARLMIGFADKQYHAWLNVYIDGEEVFYDPTVECGALSKPKTYTVERYY